VALALRGEVPAVMAVAVLAKALRLGTPYQGVIKKVLRRAHKAARRQRRGR